MMCRPPRNEYSEPRRVERMYAKTIENLIVGTQIEGWGTITAMDESDTKKDTKEATDIIFTLDSGKETGCAFRIRDKRFRLEYEFPYGHLSVRAETKYSKKYLTEYDKLLEGIGPEFSMFGFGELWEPDLDILYLFDYSQMYKHNVFGDNGRWQITDNRDGTMGMYTSIKRLIAEDYLVQLWNFTDDEILTDIDEIAYYKETNNYVALNNKRLGK